MVPITKNLVTTDKYNLKVISESVGRRWLYITVHNTANDASAANEISYMRSNSEYTSFHYAVDDKQIVQGLPDTVGAFDTSNRSFSTKELSIEICYSKSGGSRFIQAEQNTAEFIAYKLKEMGYPCDSAHVKTHQDATGKYCPHRTLDMGWTRFMNLIKSYMTIEDNKEEAPDMTEAEVKAIAIKAYNETNPAFDTVAQLRSDPTAKTFADYIQYLVDIGAIKGDGKTALGGIRLETLKALAINARKDDIENPLYESLEDIPSYWYEDVKALIEAGKIAGEDGKQINMRRNTLKAIVVANR